MPAAVEAVGMKGGVRTARAETAWTTERQGAAAVTEASSPCSRRSQYRRRNSRDQRVRNTAKQKLVQRGFREAPRDAADFWVNYHVTKRQTQRVSGQEQGMHGGVGVGTYGKSVSVGYSSGPSVRTYEDGTAVFDVIDIRSGKIVWRGVAEGRLKNKMSKADKEQLTITVVHELLNQFPPG